MVSRGTGSIFKRTDGRYFIYLPKDLVEDTAFPFPPTSSEKVRIHFKPGEKRLIIEKQNISTIARAITPILKKST